MADEDDLEARKARAEQIRAQISNILGPNKQRDEGTKVDNEGGEALSRKSPSLRPPSPREFIEKRMRDLDSANEPEAGESQKDKTPDP